MPVMPSVKRLHSNNSDEPGEVVIRCVEKDQWVEITISDDGCGMDEQTRNKLFEPFYTTKPIGEGTGLGLSISYGIVQKHHGLLSAESQPGQGATFKLRLPVVANAISKSGFPTP